MFYVYFRNVFYASATDVVRSTLEDAIAAGNAGSEHFQAGTPFDVHLESGAVAWVWEQRPIVAIIELKWSPPNPALDSIPGLLPDPGGYCYRLRYENGHLRICGTSRGPNADSARTKALNAAKKAGFTHFRMNDDTHVSELSESHK